MRYCLLLIAALIIVYAGCGEQKVKPNVNPDINEGEIPAQESWDAKVIFSDSGKTTAILYAGHLRVFAESKETLLDSGVTVDFYNPGEVKTTTLTSKRGRVEDETKNLYAMDSVVAVSDSGVTIKTDELMWRNKDAKIVSDKFVTIITSKEKIQGYGFESNQSLTNYVIYNITYTARADSLQ
ncbi:MAG TPA: LPS export ABC transporter periplasmic protein LptC [Ignavibacteriaceae bacterium]